MAVEETTNEAIHLLTNPSGRPTSVLGGGRAPLLQPSIVCRSGESSSHLRRSRSPPATSQAGRPDRARRAKCSLTPSDRPVPDPLIHNARRGQHEIFTPGGSDMRQIASFAALAAAVVGMCAGTAGAEASPI